MLFHNPPFEDIVRCLLFLPVSLRYDGGVVMLRKSKDSGFSRGSMSNTDTLPEKYVVG